MILFFGMPRMQADVPFVLDSTRWQDSLFRSKEPAPTPQQSFVRAASEVFGLNIGLWAFDRYALKGHYAYISLSSTPETPMVQMWTGLPRREESRST